MTDPRQGRAAPDRQESWDAFLAEKARFDAMVAELERMSAEHFGADPDAALWGETGTLQHWNRVLAQVTDVYFKRGEWAESTTTTSRPAFPGCALSGPGCGASTTSRIATAR